MGPFPGSGLIPQGNPEGIGMWGSKDSSIWLSLCCCMSKCQLLYVTSAFSSVDLKMGKSIFVALCLEHWGCDEQEVATDPDVLELTNESVKYLPFGWCLCGEGETGV